MQGAEREKMCLFALVRIMDDCSLHDKMLLIESMQSELSFNKLKVIYVLRTQYIYVNTINKYRYRSTLRYTKANTDSQMYLRTQSEIIVR